MFRIRDIEFERQMRLSLVIIVFLKVKYYIDVVRVKYEGIGIEG